MAASTPTILLMHEEASIRGFLTRAMQFSGPVEVTQAGSPAEARVLLAEHGFDIWLLSYGFGRADPGISLLATLGEKSGKRPRIVVMSGAPLPSVRQHALDAGADLFLEVPFSEEAMDDLLGLVEIARQRSEATDGPI